MSVINQNCSGSLLILLLMPPIAYSSVLYEHLSKILDYFEMEEGIVHQKINLHASLTTKEFTPVLRQLEQQFPTRQIIFTGMKKDNRPLCRVPDIYLSIEIPIALLQSKTGLFRYGFQSHLKNIYGNLR